MDGPTPRAFSVLQDIASATNASQRHKRNIMTESTFTQKAPSLPAWRVIWEMIRFRPWLWFVDLISVALIRACWQIAPALIIKSFFDMLTGEATLTFGIWAIVAFLFSIWLGRVTASYGFYYADVPIFADIP